MLCREPFVERVPCPTSGKVTFAERPSASRVAIVLVDVAGNTAVADRPTIASPEPSPTPIPPAIASSENVPTVPKSVVSINGKRTLRGRYGKPPLIRGTLKTPEGAAIGNARVAVTGTAGVMTDAQGRFSVRLPKGPSRTVRFAYGDSVQTVKVIVAAPVRLKVSPTRTRNGRSIKFSGSVPQAGKARTRVELQAWANGKWVPFKTVALKNGRFSGRLPVHAHVHRAAVPVPGRDPERSGLPVRGRAVEGGAGAGAAVGRPRGLAPRVDARSEPGCTTFVPLRGAFVIHLGVAVGLRDVADERSSAPPSRAATRRSGRPGCRRPRRCGASEGSSAPRPGA